MPESAGPATPLAIVAGRGGLPRQIAERRAELGLPYLLVIFQDCFEPWMDAHPHLHQEFERVGALFRNLRAESVTHIVFAGAMNRPKVKLHRMDVKAMSIAAKALALLRKGDDAMLRGFTSIFEGEGLKVIGPQEVLGEDMTVAPGSLGQHGPTARDRQDAARAAQIGLALGPLDVGQGVIVAHGVCLGVEAIEGTDLMLERVATLPSARRDAAPPRSGVLYKAPKPDQDRRLDLPTIGPATVRAVAAAGLNGIVVAAGETVLLEPGETRSAADEAGVFVFGASVEDLKAWRA
jgi:DUF1009 family protein